MIINTIFFVFAISNFPLSVYVCIDVGMYIVYTWSNRGQTSNRGIHGSQGGEG